MKRTIFCFVMILYALGMAAELPSVTLRDTDGKYVCVASLAQTGKPVIITFFATWCKPCMRELKAIDDLYDEWQEQTGVEVYAVSTDQGQDIQKVKPLADGYGWRYHVLLDPNGELKRAMNVQTIPHLFIIDIQGNVVYNHAGYTDGDEQKVGMLIMKEHK